MKRATRLLLVATVALLVVGATAPTASASDAGAECYPCAPDCPFECLDDTVSVDEVELIGDVDVDSVHSPHAFVLV